MSTTIDFAKIKASAPIDQVAQMLGLKLTAHKDQLRGPCPITKSTDPRSFVITPAKGVFYSFKEGKGGDALTLVSRVRGCDIKQAAEIISAHFGADKSDASPQPRQEKERDKKVAFDAERYLASLDPAHESLESLGVSVETLKSWRAGYSPSGVNRGRLALALHGKDDSIVGYCGMALSDAQQPSLIFPNGVVPSDYIFGSQRVAKGELHLVRTPLDVLSAWDNGADNVVCFLTEVVSSAQMQYLSVLMDEKKCDGFVLS
jgi:hypothetical protein